MSGPIIDMTPEGGFRRSTAPSPVTQIVRAAVLVAVLAGALALAAVALWVALLLIPIAFGAAIVAWLGWKVRLWQMRSQYGVTTRPPSAHTW